MSDTRKPGREPARDDGCAVDDRSGRWLREGTVRGFRLSLMKTGIFEFPAPPDADTTISAEDAPTTPGEPDAGDSEADLLSLARGKADAWVRVLAFSEAARTMALRSPQEAIRLLREAREALEENSEIG